jgi:hypothetical protein
VAVPAVFNALVALIDARAARCGAGAAARDLGRRGAPRETQDRWFDATGVELRQGYGLTEAAPGVLFNRVDRANVRGSLGYPFPDVEVAIRDPAGWAGRAGGRGARSACAARTCSGLRGAAARGAAGARRVAAHRRPRRRRARRERRVPRAVQADVHAQRLQRLPARDRARGRRDARRGARAVRAVPEPARENDIALEVRGAVARAT